MIHSIDRMNQAWKQIIETYALSSHIQKPLEVYLSLLTKWNRIHNLVGTTDPILLLSKHVSDSLAIIPYLKGPLILDVGTGAGFPGLPLAIACPHWSFTLLDSHRKKVHFLTQVVGLLSLNNVQLKVARVEHYIASTLFNTIVTRAFGSVSHLFNSAKHLCRPDGQFLIMKSKYPQEELNYVASDFTVSSIIPLSVANLSAKRCLVLGTWARS